MRNETKHGRWALPEQSWLMAMHWHNLLFMHWPLPVAALRAHIPRSLTIDTFDNMAWIGVVPFSMSGVRPRYVPPLPWLSAFPELNVRTYVVANDRPGVWFFSLDATNRLAVRGARWLFHLPYYDAHMTMREQQGRIHYRSMRTHRGALEATFAGQYWPCGGVYYAAAGTLDHWLTERYCLYSVDRRGQLWRGDIHHDPWPLQPAQASIDVNSMTYQLGLKLPTTQPLLHFAHCQEVVAWSITRVDAPVV